MAVGVLSLILAMGGCSAEENEASATGEATPDATAGTATRAGTVDPATYAGDVIMAFPVDLPTRFGAVPFTVYTGLDAATQTRLAVNAFVDLRAVQARLPELFTGVIQDSCNLEVALNEIDVEADGDRVVARANVFASIYRCRGRGSPEEEQGFRFLTQRVETVATANAQVSDNCMEFALVDLELDPAGFIGGVANLFGLTERVRTAILDKAAEVLSENRFCPELPEELATLEPLYSDGGAREIGEGGMGAALVGSVGTSAATLLQILAYAQARQLLEVPQ
ncbi:MAG: hypothetical protein AAGF74_06870 [Pseudomonadota bacterium]